MNDTPLAGVTRPCCLCMSRFDVATMSQPGPGLFACLDQQGCAARQDAAGPQAEAGPEIELAMSQREVRRGVPALPPDRGAADIGPRTGKLISTGARQ